VHYPMPLSDQPGYRGFVRAGALPVAANVARSVLSLPMHADLGEATQDGVVVRVVEAFGACRIPNGA
jgi:UDP-2-acetamido-2-deoxy-ribo-hexuluronate aminotransferase